MTKRVTEEIKGSGVTAGKLVLRNNDPGYQAQLFDH